MRTLLALAAAGLIPWSTHAQAPKPVVPDDVAASVRARVESGRVPGIVVGIVSPGGETYLAHGVLAIGKPGAVGEDTIFEIGSITKTFTGLLLADMARRGEVQLDDPVRKYLPEGVKPPSSDKREITLLDLATQRSGLPRLPANFAPADPSDPYVDYTPERLAAYLAKATLDHPVGSTYAYSNFGAGLLGYALSRAAKTDYGTLVRERIAVPLGMTVTALDVDAALSARVAQGYDAEGAKVVPAKPWTWRKTSCLAGAGGLRSTPREMLRYLAANAGLTESKLAGAIADAVKERAEAGSPGMGIGLGWHIQKRKDGVVVWHNGGTGGFRSFCGFDPKTKTGVVVLANSTASIDDIGFHLLDPGSPLQDVAKPIAVPEAKLARLDGHYDLGGGAIIHVTHEGEQLYAQLTGQQRYPVFARSETVFFFRVVPAELEFDVAADGTVGRLTLHQSGRHMPAPRLSGEAAPKERVEVPVDAKLLAEYVGAYASAPGVVLDCAVEGGHLACQLTGQPRFPVYAESETTFYYKIVDAQLVFTRNAAGKVDAVVLHQGGQTQRAERVASP